MKRSGERTPAVKNKEGFCSPLQKPSSWLSGHLGGTRCPETHSRIVRIGELNLLL